MNVKYLSNNKNVMRAFSILYARLSSKCWRYSCEQSSPYFTMLSGGFIERKNKECVRRRALKTDESIWSYVIFHSFSVDNCCH